MAKYEFTLGIGYPGATRRDIIDVCDVELEDCETEQDKLELVDEYWKDWAWSYIDGGAYPVE